MERFARSRDYLRPILTASRFGHPRILRPIAGDPHEVARTSSLPRDARRPLAPVRT